MATCTETEILNKITEIDSRLKTSNVNSFNDVILKKHGNSSKIFSSLKQYIAGDVISYNNKIYICILDSLGNDITNATYFTLIIETDTAEFEAASKWCILQGNTILSQKGVISATGISTGKFLTEITFDTNISLQSEFLTYFDISLIKTMPEFDTAVNASGRTYRDYMHGSHYCITASQNLNTIVLSPFFVSIGSIGGSYNSNLDAYYTNTNSALIAANLIKVVLVFDPTN